jgi:hypothetical protein
MADENSRVLQAAIDAATSLTPGPTSTDQSDATETTSQSDMDYEPVSEEDTESAHHAFFEELLASEEDEDGNAVYLSLRRARANYPTSR